MNVIGLSQEHENNLRKLAAHLMTVKAKPTKNNVGFDMFNFRQPLYNNKGNECGTVCCAAGHGPQAGILKHKDESWIGYINRVFGICFIQNYWNFLFCLEWAYVDNTPKGAAKRIIYLLENGLLPAWDFNAETVKTYNAYYRQRAK